MEQELLREFINTLKSGVSLSPISYVLLALVVAAGTYIGSYLRMKGQNLATKEDISEITRKIEEIRASYAAQLEDQSHENRLRLAALDRRLQSHQEAYTLWWNLLGAVYSSDIRDHVVRCQDWWTKNCLYLSAEAREDFVQAYRAADIHGTLVKDMHRGVEIRDVTANWEKILKGGETLLRSAGLPGFTKCEKEEVEQKREKHA